MFNLYLFCKSKQLKQQKTNNIYYLCSIKQILNIIQIKITAMTTTGYFKEVIGNRFSVVKRGRLYKVLNNLDHSCESWYFTLGEAEALCKELNELRK
jgi:uncharacterized membrane protein